MAKRTLRLPNSYGSVHKQSHASRRRKPYAVRITTGYDIDPQTGKSIQRYKYIGYAETRQEGYQMLAKYHENPFDLSNMDITFEEVYEEWSNRKYLAANSSTISGYTASYKICEPLYKMKFREIRFKDLQDLVDNCNKNYPTLRKLKVLLNQLYAYALKNDICTKDYSEFVDISKYADKNPNKIDRNKFTKEQIDVLWSTSDNEHVQIILMLIYSGVRISEMLDLKKVDVHLDEQYFTVQKSKTQSGIRKVPISDYTLDFFKNWYNSSDSLYLIHTPNGEQFLYRNYYDSYFLPVMELHGYSQTPHCTRHTCISLLAEAHTDSTYTKMIVGHKGAMSLAESVYTHIDVKELVKAINQIYVPDFIKDRHIQPKKKKSKGYER